MLHYFNFCSFIFYLMHLFEKCGDIMVSVSLHIYSLCNCDSDIELELLVTLAGFAHNSPISSTRQTSKTFQRNVD